MTDPIKALAAYGAAQVPPSDAEIEAWGRRMRFYVKSLLSDDQTGNYGCKLIGEAIRLMRRARPLLSANTLRPEPATSDAEIEAALTAVEGAAYDHGIAVAQGFDDTRPLLEKRNEACEVARQLMRRARPEPAPSDELETLIDALCEAAYAVSDAPDYEVAAEAELAAQKALTDWVGQRIAAVERERDGLLRTEFGISSYPVPGKASDGWPDSFSVWRLKDGRTRIYRQAVAPTDADVEGCNAAELREALFNRNNDVERLVEQRDGLLRAAKEAMRLGMCIDALDILRAEVARVEGKP